MYLAPSVLHHHSSAPSASSESRSTGRNTYEEVAQPAPGTKQTCRRAVLTAASDPKHENSEVVDNPFKLGLNLLSHLSQTRILDRLHGGYGINR